MTSEKICSKCKSCPAKNQKRGGYCVECQRIAGRQNYRDNKKRYFKQAKLRDDQLDELINSSKDCPCCDCGVKYPPYVMDLDHRDPSIKVLKISAMRRRKMAFDTIREEMAKCDVVCANCHRERTNKQNPARYTKTLEIAFCDLKTSQPKGSP